MDQHTPSTHYQWPAQRTPLVGRQTDLVELAHLVSNPNCRLITLVGPGGIGKTRLALEVADRQRDAFAHGVWYVPLMSLQSDIEIVPTIINVLGIHIRESNNLTNGLIQYLRQRHLLLLLDSFEHVLGGAALLSDMLAAAPNIKMMVTSREVLNLQEEWVWQVNGLQFPSGTAPDNLTAFSALQLFAARAQQVRHDFVLETQLGCVIQICQLVSGMPLALELAASWLKTLACHEIVTEIQKSIDFLATNIRNVPERHRSLRNTFDQSWKLCTPTEQAVFCKLSVFRGGFERDAALAVADASLATLSALVEKSMLWKLPSGRYRMHDLLRQYAAEKLKAVGEGSATEAAHVDYYAHFVDHHTLNIKGRQQLRGLDALQSDFNNIRAAWHRAVARCDASALMLMVEGIALFCDMRAQYQVGETLLLQAVQSCTSVENLAWNHIRARWLQVWILQELTPIPEAIRAALDACVAMAKADNDSQTVALCLWTLGELNRFGQDDATSIAAYEAALQIYDALDDAYYVLRVLRGMVHCYFFSMHLHLWNKMPALNQRHLELARQTGDRTGMAHAIFYDARMAMLISGLHNSRALLNEAMTIWQEMGDRKSVGVVLMNLGMLSWLQGDLAEAQHLLESAMTLAEDVNYLVNRGSLLAILGIVAVLQGDVDRAQKLSEQSMAANHPNKTDFFMFMCLAIVAIEAERWTEASGYLQHIVSTVSFPLDQVMVLPLVSCIMANDGLLQQAVELLGRSYSHPVAVTGWLSRWQRLSELQGSLEANLGTLEYQMAWQRGMMLDLDNLVDELIAYLRNENNDDGVHKAQPLIEPLSERELEVLELLATGLSNREIAESLYLTVGTIKVHARNIYRKLDAANRTEATAIARELNLIS